MNHFLRNCPSYNLINHDFHDEPQLKYIYRAMESLPVYLNTGRGSSVGNVSALKAAVPRLTLASLTFSRGKYFPLSLIEGKQVVRY